MLCLSRMRRTLWLKVSEIKGRLSVSGVGRLFCWDVRLGFFVFFLWIQEWGYPLRCSLFCVFVSETCLLSVEEQSVARRSSLQCLHCSCTHEVLFYCRFKLCACIHSNFSLHTKFWQWYKEWKNYHKGATTTNYRDLTNGVHCHSWTNHTRCTKKIHTRLFLLFFPDQIQFLCKQPNLRIFTACLATSTKDCSSRSKRNLTRSIPGMPTRRSMGTISTVLLLFSFPLIFLPHHVIHFRTISSYFFFIKLRITKFQRDRLWHEVDQSSKTFSVLKTFFFFLQIRLAKGRRHSNFYGDEV